MLGPAVAEFERFIGAEHGVGVGSGLDALRLALLALEVGRGDEVVLPVKQRDRLAVVVLALVTAQQGGASLADAVSRAAAAARCSEPPRSRLGRSLERDFEPHLAWPRSLSSACKRTDTPEPPLRCANGIILEFPGQSTTKPPPACPRTGALAVGAGLNTR